MRQEEEDGESGVGPSRPPYLLSPMLNLILVLTRLSPLLLSSTYILILSYPFYPTLFYSTFRYSILVLTRLSPLL